MNMIAGKTHLVARALAIGVGAFFVRSAMFHMENSYAFLHSVYAYHLVSAHIGILIAAITPFLLLTVGIALLFFTEEACAAFRFSAFLCGLFTVVQISALARGLNIACGCFAPVVDNPIGPKSIAISVGCMVAALIGMSFTHTRSSQGSFQECERSQT